MFMLMAAIPALLLAWTSGGRFGRLADVELRHLWLVWLGLGAQVVLFTPLGDGIATSVMRIAHIVTYVPIVAFLAANRRSGFGLVAAGVVCNVIAISANGGAMPADAVAQQVIFGDPASGAHLNTDSSADRLLILGDVMSLPSWMPWANAFSIGDLLIVVGACWALVRATREIAAVRSFGGLATVAGRFSMTPWALAAGCIAWSAIACAVGGLVGTGQGVLAAVACVAVAAIAIPGGRGPAAFAVASAVVAFAGIGAGLESNSGAFAALVGAGVLLVVVYGDECGAPAPAGVVAHLLAGAAGVAAGTVILHALGMADAILVGGVTLMLIAGLHALVQPRSGHGGSGRAMSASDGWSRGLLSAIACVVGVVCAAASVQISGHLGVGNRGAGAVIGALALGAAGGIAMAAVAPAGMTSRAIGGLLICGAPCAVLMAEAQVPLTIIGAALVFGLILGGAAWEGRAQLAVAARRFAGPGAATGALIGATPLVGTPSGVLWAAGALLAAIGVALVARSLATAPVASVGGAG